MRKKLAFALALAMSVTSIPANGLVGYAEEVTESVEAGEALDEIISEDDSMEVAAGDTEDSSYEADQESEDIPDVQQAEDGAIPFVASVEELSEDTGIDSDDYDDAEDEENEYEVNLNESIVLKPTIADGSGLTYQWYKRNVGEEYTLIADANEAEYQVVANLNTAEYYRCVVTDESGKSKNWTCRIVVRTLKIDERTTQDIYMQPDTKVTLQAFVESVIPGANITYQWFKCYENSDGMEMLENEKTASLEVSAPDGGWAEYECHFSDGYDQRHLSFIITVDTGLTADAEQYEVWAREGENATIRVIASSDYSDKYPLRYQWYTGEHKKIEGATEASYTVSAMASTDGGGYREYYCEVTDGYNSEYVWFIVSVDTGLSVSANDVWVTAGEDVELKVQASTMEAYGPLKYEWEVKDKYGEWDYIPNEEAATYVVKNVQGLQEYRCNVSDRLNSKSVAIKVGLSDERVAYGQDFESARELKVGEENTATIKMPGTSVYFKFVPEKSGEWKLYSASDEDTVAYLYNSEKSLLEENDDDPHVDGNNFGLAYELVQGRTYYLRCGYFGSAIGSYKVMAKFVEEGKSEHTWKDVKISRQPTCEAAGEKLIRCEKCGSQIPKQLPALGHAYPESWTVRKAVTCLEDGVEYRICSRCGKEETRTIKATGSHQFGAYVVTKQPTVLAAGVQTRTCAVCHTTESTEIAKLSGVIHLTTKKLPLQVKKNVQLSRILKDLAAGDSIASCVSSKPKVATVDKNGKVVGKSAGTTVVTITLASGVSDKVTIVVQKKAVAASSITNVTKSLKLKLGEKYTLAPVINPITTADKASYSSSNKKIVTVSKKGVITAKKSGTAKITVKAGKKKVTVKVTVEKVAPTGMNGVPASKTLKKGKSFTIKPKLTPSGAEAKIIYSSSNKKVATVNTKGKVTAKKKGTATITVKAGGVTKTCVVTVK